VIIGSNAAYFSIAHDSCAQRNTGFFRNCETTTAPALLHMQSDFALCTAINKRSSMFGTYDLSARDFLALLGRKQMGKINVFTLLTTVVVQLVVGYLWFGTHLFGGVIGGHGIDFLQTDVISLLLIVLSSYGLTHIVEGVKDTNGAMKTGLTVGGFAIGFPIVMLLNLMGMSHITLLVVFTYIVLITTLTGIVTLKLKKA
jgi:hypothetical protein